MSRMYACVRCGCTLGHWEARCPRCSKMGMERAGAKQRLEADSDTRDGVVAMSSVKATFKPRIQCGIPELDRVLGHNLSNTEAGYAYPSVILFGGRAGCGKSTVLLQLISLFEGESLYVAPEESPQSLRARAERLGLGSAIERLHTLHYSEPSKILSVLRRRDPRFVIIDSINYLEAASPESGDVHSEHVRFAKMFFEDAHRAERVTILVSHLNKKADF